MGGEIIIDISQIMRFNKRMISALTECPLDAEKMMNQAGKKMRSKLSKKSPATSAEHKHKLNKSWKGQLVADGVSSLNIKYKIWSAAPHFHLINNGHRQVAHDGRTVGFVQGLHYKEQVAQEMEAVQYPRIINKGVAKMLEKIAGD